MSEAECNSESCLFVICRQSWYQNHLLFLLQPLRAKVTHQITWRYILLGIFCIEWKWQKQFYTLADSCCAVVHDLISKYP